MATDTEQRAKAIYVFANDKGGMSAVDREGVNRIIMEASGGSAYTKRQLKQDAKVEAKIVDLRAKLEQLTDSRRNALSQGVEERVAELERTRSLERVCAVIDFDMFYAAVEIRDRPELADKPVAVGGVGMISTANYVARRWGVRSAMPGFVGKELCRRGPEFGMPKAELVFVPCNYAKYATVANAARGIYREYDPHVRSFSLDEAYLDLTDYVRHRARLRSHRLATEAVHKSAGEAAPASDDKDCHCEDGEDDKFRTFADYDPADGGDGSPGTGGRLRMATDLLSVTADEVVAEIRHRVCASTGGLTTSAGIGPNFMLAKVCADQRKPNGQFRVGSTRSEILYFLDSLPVRKIGGIGRVQEKLLDKVLGVHTCGQMLEKAVDIRAVFTPRTADWLLRAALGWSDGLHWEHNEHVADEFRGNMQKGMSVERTFSSTSDRAQLLDVLSSLCATLAGHMAANGAGSGLCGRTVTLKLKTSDFDVSTRDSTGAPARTVEDLVQRTEPLLQKEFARAQSERRVLCLRLMGVRVTKLEEVDGRSEPQHQKELMESFVRSAEGAAKRAPGRLVCASACPPEDADFACGSEAVPRTKVMRRDQEQAKTVGEGSSSRYMHVNAAEVDPAVLAELPLQVREEVKTELEAWTLRQDRRMARADIGAPSGSSNAGPVANPRRRSGQATITSFVSVACGHDQARSGRSRDYAASASNLLEVSEVGGTAPSGAGKSDAFCSAAALLAEMGFPAVDVQAALAASGGRPDGALDLLLRWQMAER